MQTHKSRNIFKTIGVIVTLIAATAVSSIAAAEVKMGGTLNVTAISKWRTLNPAVQSGSATGIPGSQIFAGLLRVDGDFIPQPYLADSWSVSADGLRVTFNLNKTATFHDGQPITSADVAFSLGVSKANHPFGSNMFRNVETVETPDVHTAIFVLSGPTPALFASLQPLLMPILPKHIYDDGQDMKKHPRNNENVVGSGPFMVAEHKLGEQLILEKNPNFFIKGRPYLDRILISSSRNSAAQVLELDRGQLDFYPFAFLPATDLQRLAKNEKILVIPEGHEALGPVAYLEFNLRNEIFDDVRVRQGIAYAIDTKVIASLLSLGYEPATSLVHSGSPFYNGTTEAYEIDLEKAAALLDAAGFPLGDDGVRFSFTLDMPTYAKARHAIISEVTKQALKQVGIEVTLRISPDFGSWVSRVGGWEHDATLSGIWGYSDPVIGIHRLFSCDNIRNVIWSNTQGYCNESVDALLETAGTSLVIAERLEAYMSFQEIVAEELPLLPLATAPTVTVHRTAVKNVPIHGWGVLSPWDEIYLDE